MIKVNKYNLSLMLRRALGIAILFIIGTWAFGFAIKLICYLLYAGASVIDKFFGLLVRWSWRMKRLKGRITYECEIEIKDDELETVQQRVDDKSNEELIKEGLNEMFFADDGRMESCKLIDVKFEITD